MGKNKEDEKVIFLDIDGVINKVGTIERWEGCFGMDKKLISILHRLVKETKAKLVLSSTWRHDPDWRNTMKACGIKYKFLDKTISLWTPNSIRGDEIKEWLDRHPEVKKYAIIDDDSDFYPEQKLFQTSYKTGLTDKIANDIIKYFKL